MWKRIRTGSSMNRAQKENRLRWAFKQVTYTHWNGDRWSSPMRKSLILMVPMIMDAIGRIYEVKKAISLSKRMVGVR